MKSEDRIRALKKIAASGYNGWAGSNRISNDQASGIVAAHGNALREQEKSLKNKATTQAGIGVTGMGLGAASGGYAASRLAKMVRPPAGVSRLNLSGKAGVGALLASGLIYGGKKMWDKHKKTNEEAGRVGDEARATENWVRYFDGIKGKLR